MIALYGLKSCDTCRKARRALDEAGLAFGFVDIREEADLAAKVPVWLAVDAPLLNRASTTWRGLPDKEKARAESDLAGLLIEHPALIKRPVIETGGEIHVGWRPDTQAALGL